MSHAAKRFTLVLLALFLIAGIILYTFNQHHTLSAHAAAAQAVGKVSTTPLSVYFGSDYDDFYALNAASGTLRWRYHFQQGSTWSSPIVQNGVVYVMIDVNSATVQALRASDGSVIWTYQTPSNTSGSAALALANGLLYFTAGNNAASTIFALHANDGSIAWKYSLTKSYFGVPTVANGVLYTAGALNQSGSPSPHLYAFHAQNGSPIWSQSIPYMADTGLAVASGVIYYGGPIVSLYAVNATNGHLIWSSQTYGSPFSTPVVATGVIYYNAASAVAAVKASDGSLLWHYDLGQYSSFDTTVSPTLVNGVIYIGNGLNRRTQKNMLALNATNGALIWRCGTPAVSTTAAVSTSLGLVYVGLNDGTLATFNIAHGRPAWSYKTSGIIYTSSPPVVA